MFSPMDYQEEKQLKKDERKVTNMESASEMKQKSKWQNAQHLG